MDDVGGATMASFGMLFSFPFEAPVCAIVNSTICCGSDRAGSDLTGAGGWTVTWELQSGLCMAVMKYWYMPGGRRAVDVCCKDEIAVAVV